jgi:hypothetical protein
VNFNFGIFFQKKIGVEEKNLQEPEIYDCAAIISRRGLKKLLLTFFFGEALKIYWIVTNSPTRHLAKLIFLKFNLENLLDIKNEGDNIFTCVHKTRTR